MMTHDKIKNAARRRMTETGESYAAARRAVIKAFRAAGTGVSPPDTRSFAISYSDMGRISRWDAARHGDGPGHGGVEIYADVLKVRMAGFHLDIPRTSVRSVKLSTQQTRGTIGVHSRRGTWIVNGSHHGLVEVTIDPPCYTARQPDTLFLRMRVTSLIVSLVDPDGFIAAIRDDSAA